MVITGLLVFSTISCEKYFDINKDPDSILDAPLPQLWTSASVNVGFTGGSDILRYSSLITQQFSGQSSGSETQTQQYEKYLISGSDLNNVWSSIYATTLNDLEQVIQKANQSNSPHYAGVAKLLKAYTYQIAVDTWGDIPYSEAQKLTANLSPKYDNDTDIYTSLLGLIDEGIDDINQATSTLSPGTNSTFYPGDFTTSKVKWIKFGHTLKLRILMHYSQINSAFATAEIANLVNSSTFFSSNDDNFEMTFTTSVGGQNPIYQFEIERPGYLAPHKTLVDMMSVKSDPRIPFYFNPAANGGGFVGSYGGAPSSPGDYSTLGVFLTGNEGEVPVRLLTYAEYNFLRAEAAVRFGIAGDAQTFFQEGIKASMEAAGVTSADITIYLATNGILLGTNEQKIQQIIQEKFVANYGVAVEPWTDWRRTGYPTLTIPANAVVNYIPRSLYYPQSEVDLNSNSTQKPDMNVKVFWDVN